MGVFVAREQHVGFGLLVAGRQAVFLLVKSDWEL